MPNSDEASERRPDALTELLEQNQLVTKMLDLWDDRTARLRQQDDVDDRWQRGSAAKMLLQHLAVREAAKQDIAARLREIDQPQLSAELEADGVARREAIDRLDERARGRQAISLNNPDVDHAVTTVAGIVRAEISSEDRDLIPAIRGVLGDETASGLPSARSVQLRSDTHPSPVTRWYERVKPLKAVVAFYSHLRSSPSGVTYPGVDEGREHSPGVSNRP